MKEPKSTPRRLRATDANGRTTAAEERLRPSHAGTGFNIGPAHGQREVTSYSGRGTHGWGYSSPSAPNLLSAGARDRRRGGPAVWFA